MNRRLLVTLALLTLLFVSSVAWLGFRLTHGEAKSLRLEREHLVNAQLAAISSEIRTFIDLVATELDQLEPSPSPVALRRLRDSTPRIEQVFILNRQQQLLFPDQSMASSQGERSLSEQIAPLLRKKAFPSLAQRDAETGQKPYRGAWFSSYHDDGLHLYYLRPLSEELVLGVELNRSRLLADLLAVLQHSEMSGAESTNLRLQTDRGEVLRSWGERTVQADLVRELAVSEPLQSFRLVAEAAPLTSTARSAYFNLTAGAMFLGLSVLLLGIFAAREYRSELREAETRVSFVNKVSHELRTPLTSVRLYTDLLRDSIDPSNDRALKYLRVIGRETERLSRTIGNVLHLGDIDRQRLSIKRSPTSIREVIETVVELYQPLLGAQGMAVTVKFPEQEQLRMVDADALAQICHNILSNAEKYARRGALQIVVEATGDTVRIQFSDEGPGVPTKLQDTIFEPFFRISDSVHDGVSGTGIGLGVSRELARLHGGDLTVVPSDIGLSLLLSIEAATVAEESGDEDESSRS